MSTLWNIGFMFAEINQLVVVSGICNSCKKGLIAFPDFVFGIVLRMQHDMSDTLLSVINFSHKK